MQQIQSLCTLWMHLGWVYTDGLMFVGIGRTFVNQQSVQERARTRDRNRDLSACVTYACVLRFHTFLCEMD